MIDKINFQVNKSFDTISNGFSIPTIMSNIPKQPTLPQTSETIKRDEVTLSTPKKKQPLGKIVLSSMVAVGIGVLLLTKGLSGNTAEKIRKMADKWENDFLRYACKNKAVNTINESIVKTSQSVKNLFNLSDAIANFTAIKDTGFHIFTSWDFVNPTKRPKLHKFLNKYLPMQKVCDFFTKHVLKISVGAVDSKYKQVGNAVENLEARLRKNVAKYGQNLTLEQQEKLKKLLDLISPTYKKGFDKSAREKRLSKIFTNLKNLAKDVKQGLLSPFKKETGHGAFRRVYSSYITDTLAKPAKQAHQKAIEGAKLVFSNDIDDVFNKLRGTATELKHCFSATDKDSRLLLGELLENLDKYKGFSGSNESKLRQGIQKQIMENLGAIRTSFSNSPAVKTNGAKANALFNELQETLTNSSQKGLIQNILTEVKGFLPEKEYKHLRNLTNNLNNKLNEAIDKEGNNLFNKIAESRVGSIPTDMLGLATMAGTGAWAISTGKDKDEKVSATLKVGIPLLGGIGTYFYSAAKAFSGTTNLIFGALTTLVLNKIGGSVYNYYQKCFVEKKSVKEIAKDAYDKATNA